MRVSITAWKFLWIPRNAEIGLAEVVNIISVPVFYLKVSKHVLSCPSAAVVVLCPSVPLSVPSSSVPCPFSVRPSRHVRPIVVVRPLSVCPVVLPSSFVQSLSRRSIVFQVCCHIFHYYLMSNGFLRNQETTPHLQSNNCVHELSSLPCVKFVGQLVDCSIGFSLPVDYIAIVHVLSVAGVTDGIILSVLTAALYCFQAAGTDAKRILVRSSAGPRTDGVGRDALGGR